MFPLEEMLERVGGEKRIVYSLERFLAALEDVGNPHKNVKSLVIAGTNGKGSTTLYLSSALREAGHNVATYLSPHLQAVEERFLYNLAPASSAALTEVAQANFALAEKHSLSYFEFLTLIFFVWAKSTKADFLVLECGLGGRLDATNVTDPLGTVLTNVALDHQAFLGNTVEAILEEKLGVLRPEALLFTGVKDAALLSRIEARCNELDAIYYFSKELRTEVKSVSAESQEITVNGYPLMLHNPSEGTVENAALAFLTMRIVFPKVSPELLKRAFEKVKTPGRMEVVQTLPRVILSGDHNPAGVTCLLTTLERLKISRPRIVCAFSPDKPFEEMYCKLKEASSDILLTTVSRLKTDLPAKYFAMGPIEENPLQAIDQMIAKMQPSETLVVTGSLYLIGEVRKKWQKKVSFF